MSPITVTTPTRVGGAALKVLIATAVVILAIPALAYAAAISNTTVTGVVLDANDCLDGYCKTIFLATTTGRLLPVGLTKPFPPAKEGIRITVRGRFGAAEWAGTGGLYDAVVAGLTPGPSRFRLRAFLGEPKFAFIRQPAIFGLWAVTGGGHAQGTTIGGTEMAVTDINVPPSLRLAVSRATRALHPTWMTLRHDPPSTSVARFTLLALN